MSTLIRLDEDGHKEKHCFKCDEWWPADKEFFFRSGKGSRQLHSWCKACYIEWRKARRLVKKLAMV